MSWNLHSRWGGQITTRETDKNIKCQVVTNVVTRAKQGKDDGDGDADADGGGRVRGHLSDEMTCEQ